MLFGGGGVVAVVVITVLLFSFSFSFAFSFLFACLCCRFFVVLVYSTVFGDRSSSDLIYRYLVHFKRTKHTQQQE